MEIKDITSNKILIQEAVKNAANTNSKKRRRQTFRLNEMICDGAPLRSNDSDTVRTVATILSSMRDLRLIRYGANAYAEWTGIPPQDLLDAGLSKNHLYRFNSANLQDPIAMYADIDDKAKFASESLLQFIFNAAVGIDLRDRLQSLSDMTLDHINSKTDHYTRDGLAALQRFAKLIDDQNGPGAFAAALMYPILNKEFSKKRKHALFGFRSNTGKGLLLAMIRKLYVGAPVDMTTRPNERDVYSMGAWNKIIMNRWLVIIGDTAETDLTYDFIKNLYEQPQAISGRNERDKQMFYGNVYIATNHRQDYFADKEIYTRVFYLAMNIDIDQVLGDDIVDTLDTINRDTIIKYLVDNEQAGIDYWNNYKTPKSFYEDNTGEQLYDEFIARYDGTVAPVRDIKAWVNNTARYKMLMDLVAEYIGKPKTVSYQGKSIRAIDLRSFSLYDK